MDRKLQSQKMVNSALQPCPSTVMTRVRFVGLPSFTNLAIDFTVRTRARSTSCLECN